jgi:hypothetical protein
VCRFLTEAGYSEEELAFDKRAMENFENNILATSLGAMIHILPMEVQCKATQIRVLRANRIAFFLNASGWPVVLRSAVEGGQRNEKPKQRWSSNAA